MLVFPTDWSPKNTSLYFAKGETVGGMIPKIYQSLDLDFDSREEGNPQNARRGGGGAYKWNEPTCIRSVSSRSQLAFDDPKRAAILAVQLTTDWKRLELDVFVVAFLAYGGPFMIWARRSTVMVLWTSLSELRMDKFLCAMGPRIWNRELFFFFFYGFQRLFTCTSQEMKIQDQPSLHGALFKMDGDLWGDKWIGKWDKISLSPVCLHY